MSYGSLAYGSLASGSMFLAVTGRSPSEGASGAEPWAAGPRRIALASSIEQSP